MSCRFQKQIDFLLGNACPSIRYLVHRDILKTPVGEPFMRELQEDILAQPNVAKHLAAQREDGWFGVELHGSEAMDHHISKLLGAGVERDDPALTRAAHALTTPGIAGNHKNWFRGGEALDADGRGGNRAVVASILASVGVDEATPALRGEIGLSFEHLSAARDYASVDDFSVRTKNCRYYKPKSDSPVRII